MEQKFKAHAFLGFGRIVLSHRMAFSLKVKCLGFCNNVRTTIVIYPEQEFYTEATEKDLEEIYGKLIN